MVAILRKRYKGASWLRSNLEKVMDELNRVIRLGVVIRDDARLVLTETSIRKAGAFSIRSLEASALLKG
ncbi:hypothetical protein LguiA_023797 [Lonicera macranthoides]